MSQQNVKTAAHESSETIFLTTKNGKGLIKIGQVVGNNRYGNAVVYNIHGEQGKAPIKVLGGGVIVMGGSASFDIVYYNGSRNYHLPESILCSGLPWYICDEIVTQKEIDKLLLLADEKETEEKAAIEKEKKEFNEAISSFKVSDKYKDLIQGDDHYSGKLAANNIRIELKKQFKGVKFSVRKSHFGSLSILWIDSQKGRC